MEEEKQPTILPGNLFRRTESTEKRVRPEVEARKVELVADKRKKQNKWDQYMRKFEYVKALDAVIAVCLECDDDIDGFNNDNNDNNERLIIHSHAVREILLR